MIADMGLSMKKLDKMCSTCSPIFFQLQRFLSTKKLNQITFGPNISRFLQENHLAVRRVFHQSPQVRDHLIKLCKIDPMKYYKPYEKEIAPRRTRIQMISQSELEELQRKAKESLEEKFTFPKLPHVHEPQNAQKTEDADCLDKVDVNRLVFVDIGGEQPRDFRRVWERRQDGSLWESDHTTQARLVKTMFRCKHQDPFGNPPALQPQSVQALLHQGQYVFLLRLAYVNFFKREPQLLSILNTVFNHLCEKEMFEALTSTRYYPIFVHFLLTNYPQFVSYLRYHLSQNNVSDVVGIFSFLQLLVEEMSGLGFASTKFLEDIPESDVITNGYIEKTSTALSKRLSGLDERTLHPKLFQSLFHCTMISENIQNVSFDEALNSFIDYLRDEPSVVAKMHKIN